MWCRREYLYMQYRHSNTISASDKTLLRRVTLGGATHKCIGQNNTVEKHNCSYSHTATVANTQSLRPLTGNARNNAIRKYCDSCQDRSMN